ncbi:UNVERIFIED_CONTAM: two-component system chemotaxis sensor kinase CheA [Acetivibrio alkalicellulosi]
MSGKNKTELQRIHEEVIVEILEHIRDAEGKCLILDKEKDKEDLIDGLFRAFHSIKGLAGFIDEKFILKISDKVETLIEVLRYSEVLSYKEYEDLILSACDSITSVCNDKEIKENQIFIKKLDIFLNDIDFKVNNIEKSKKNKDNKPEVEIINEKDLNFSSNQIRKIHMNNEENRDQVKKETSKTLEYIRVMPEDIDFLSEVMGEIIITQSLLEAEITERVQSNDLFAKKFVEMTNATMEVQNLIMSLGMVPLKSNFQKIKKVVNETIKELGKDVQLKILGENTEMERDLAEKITDPLMHIVKNCISHGIEPKEERIANGKDECGVVSIEAYTKSESVYLEISDDGGGINLDRVLKKAIDKKLANPNIHYSEEEILDFIFMPGFSTSENVNSISGRGVGLDVVKTEIAKIGGKVEVINYPKKGCTFIIKTPLNLAVLDGVIVKIGKEKFIIPTTYLKKILQKGEYSWIKERGKKKMVRVKDEIVQLLPRKKIFGIDNYTENEDGDLCVLLLQIRRERRALAVEKVDERRKLAVKNLDNVYCNPAFVMGASILEDGRVSFIVDVESIFRMEGEA